MPKVMINDVNIYYEIHGEGPELLFIGGTGGDLRNKPNVFDSPLSRHFKILSYDQRGMGQTDKPDEPYTMADYAGDAYGLLKEVGWKSSHVVGVSFGGMVAQEYALTYPSAVRKLVLACTSSGGRGRASFPLHELPDNPEDRAKIMISILDTRQNDEWVRRNPEKYRDLVAQWAAPSKFEDEPGRAVGSRRQLEARRYHDTYDRLPQLKMPVFICGGKYDGISPPENLEALHRQIRTSRLEFFEGGHMFMNQDPNAFKRIIEFLL